jgi:uncharacterized protein YqgV (UPF0045/DUF77 family)
MNELSSLNTVIECELIEFISVIGGVHSYELIVLITRFHLDELADESHRMRTDGMSSADIL